MKIFLVVNFNDGTKKGKEQWFPENTSEVRKLEVARDVAKATAREGYFDGDDYIHYAPSFIKSIEIKRVED